MKTLFISIFTLFVSDYCFSQIVIRNYGFEDFDAVGRLIGWSPQNTNGHYMIGPDPQAHTGGVSILIAPKPDAPADRGTGLCNTVLTRNLLEGKKKVTITAYIKTEDLSDGIASIWMQLNGPGGIISDKNCDDKSAKGSSDWTKYSIELPLTGDVQSIGFGCKMNGTGKAWYDDFEVLIDDVPLR